MRYEYPEYYSEFSCVGGSCKDSCCIGWELDIDDESYEYYKSVSGSFGERLRNSMDENEDNTFVLSENGRCPFLNNKNLCDIYINLGEASLCNVCTQYPRSHEIIGDYKQSDAGLSCLEVARLHFELARPVRYVTGKDKLPPEEKLTRQEAKKLDCILYMRDKLIELVQTDYELYRWESKAMLLLDAADILQLYWNSGEYRQIKILCRKLKKTLNKPKIYPNQSDAISMKDILYCIDDMEMLRDDMKNMINRYSILYDEKLWKRFVDEVDSRYNLWHGQILTYYIFRYFIRAYYDNNIVNKIVMAVYSAMIIQCMDYVRWCDNNYSFTLEDRIDVAHMYSKEIEHSDDNLAKLEEEFIFGDEYKPHTLQSLLVR